jgi:hypothetical protein
VALTAAQRAERNRQIAAAQDAIRRGESITAQNIVNNMIGRNVGGAANALQNAINNIQPTVVQSPLVPLNPETGDTDDTTTTAETVDPNAYAKELEAQRRDRLVQVTRQFMKENGMEEMMAGMEKYVRAGYTGDQIWIMLSSDDAYKAAYNRRFAANEERARKGLARLLPATYIELEDGYRSAMMSRGIPEGLFDSTDDFTELIAGDVSVREVEDRLDTAVDYVNFEGNSAVKAELREIYGMTDGEMYAYVLDQDRTQDYLDREMNSRRRQAAVGGSASNANVGISDALRNEIADMYQGYNWERAYQESSIGMTSVAKEEPLYERLGLLSGEEANSDDLVKEQFNITGAAEAASKKKRLASQERARFGGSSALSRTSLAQKRAR